MIFLFLKHIIESFGKIYCYHSQLLNICHRSEQSKFQKMCHFFWNTYEKFVLPWTVSYIYWSILKLRNRNNQILLMTFIYSRLSLNILAHSSITHRSWGWGFRRRYRTWAIGLLGQIFVIYHHTYYLQRQCSFDLVHHGVRQDVVEEWGEVPILHCWLDLTDIRIRAGCLELAERFVWKNEFCRFQINCWEISLNLTGDLESVDGWMVNYSRMKNIHLEI